VGGWEVSGIKSRGKIRATGKEIYTREKTKAKGNPGPAKRVRSPKRFSNGKRSSDNGRSRNGGRRDDLKKGWGGWKGR